MSAGSVKHTLDQPHVAKDDWGDFWAAAKAAVVLLALLAAYLSLGSCIYVSDGYGGGGYGRPPYEQHEHDGYYRGGYGRGGYEYGY